MIDEDVSKRHVFFFALTCKDSASETGAAASIFNLMIEVELGLKSSRI